MVLDCAFTAEAQVTGDADHMGVTGNKWAQQAQEQICDSTPIPHDAPPTVTGMQLEDDMRLVLHSHRLISEAECPTMRTIKDIWCHASKTRALSLLL